MIPDNDTFKKKVECHFAIIFTVEPPVSARMKGRFARTESVLAT
jgi:hypothetical protein